MKKILLLVFMILAGLPLWAHTGTIQGAVYDAQTNQPIQGAHVVLIDHEKNTVTDLFGNFKLKDLAAGTYQLKISFVGYQTNTQTLRVQDGETTTLMVRLEEEGLNLQEVTVQYKPEYNFNILNKVDLELRPFQNAQEMLRVVPGLFIAQHAGGGKAEQMFLRGFDIDHGTDIWITVDGMPVNMVSHAHGQGYADLHFLIPELVSQVNFQKGSYYTEKGNFSTTGYVNFNTTNRLKNSMIKMEAGQYDTYRLVGMFDLLGEKGSAKNQSAYLATEYNFSQNYFESPQNFNRINVFGKYHGFISPNQLLSVSFSTFRSQWDASGQVPERAIRSGLISRFGSIDNTEGGNTSRTNLNVQLNSFNANGGVFKNQIFYTHYDFELYSNFTFFLENPIEGDQIRQKENRRIWGYNGSYTQEYKIGNIKTTSNLGVSLRYDDINDSELSFTQQRHQTTRNITLGNIDEINLALYLDQTFQLSRNITLQAGVRFDHFRFQYEDLLQTTYQLQTATQNLVSPKLNLYYNPRPNLQFYLHSGFSFHSNDTRVVLQENGKKTLPRAFGNEIGTIWKPFPRLMSNISVWTLDLEQEFVYVGDAGIVEPSGRTFRTGIDVSLRWQLLNWLYLDTDFNQTLARSTDSPQGENYIPLAPLQTSTAGLTAQFANGFSGSLRYRYLGNRPANEDNSIVAKGYFLLDAVGSFRKPKYEIGFNIQNLLNQEWKEAQFDTESRLQNENQPVSEIHFTPGSPFFARLFISYFF